MNIFTSKSLESTYKYAFKLAEYMYLNKIPLRLALDGGLASGKTSFTKGFVSYFNKEILVNSPTYTIINDYSNNDFNVYHCDLYRINSKEDLYGSGFFEILEDINNILIVEWANKLCVFDSFVKIQFESISTKERAINILNRSFNL